MSIRERVLELISTTEISTTELEKRTGIDRYKWGNIKNKKQRINEEHIEALNEIWPEYAYWLSTGKTLPDAGQISPEIETARSNSLKAENKAG